MGLLASAAALAQLSRGGGHASLVNAVSMIMRASLSQLTSQSASFGSASLDRPGVQIAAHPAASGSTSRLYSSLASASHADEHEEEESLELIRSRIFGTHIGNGLPSGRKVLSKKLVGQKIAYYYNQPYQKADPLYVDPDLERRQAKLAQLRRRGKGPPKKGSGKRSKK